MNAVTVGEGREQRRTKDSAKDLHCGCVLL